MRIFVAIPIGDTLGEEVEKISSRYTDLGENIRWIKRKNLHITLVPPWEVKNPNDTIRRLDAYKPSNEKIEIKFKKIEAGPNKNRPRLIWAVGTTPKKLEQLSANLCHILKFKSNMNRRFLLHLTIARFNPKNVELNNVKEFNASINWNAELTEFALMESKLLRSGAEYEVIKKFKI